MTRVKCPQCKTEFRATDATYGRKVKCKCGCVLRMPDAPIDAAVVDATQALPPIRFQCPSCQQALQVKAEFAGKVSQCKCGAKIRVPSPTSAAPPTSDPFGSNDPFANQDPFANTGGDFMSAASAGPVANVAPKYRKPQKKSGPKTVVKKRPVEKTKPGGGISIDGEIIGGVLAMLGAVVWFVGGLFAGYIFFYPPILFFIGLAGVIKGMLDGD